MSTARYGTAARYGSSARYGSPTSHYGTSSARRYGTSARYGAGGIPTRAAVPAWLTGGKAPAPRVTPQTFTLAQGSAVTAVALRNELRRQSSKNRNLFQRVTGNFAGDVLSTVTSLPSMAQVGAHNVAAANAVPLAALSRAGVPKLKWSERLIRSAAKTDVQLAKGTAADYRYRYGDLAHVNVVDLVTGRGESRKNAMKFVRKSEEHPGLLAMDIASGWSAAGAGVRAGASIGAKLTGSGRLAAIAEKSVLSAGTSVSGGRVSTGARFRPPKVRELPLGENADRVVSRVVIKRRPYSKNPITRGVQKKVVEPVAQSFAKFLEARAESGGFGSGVTKPFGKVAKFNRANARAGRDMRWAADLERARRLRVESVEYRAATRALVGKYGQPGAAALHLHARDLIEVPGASADVARTAVADFMRSGLDDAVREYHAKSKGASRSIQAVRDIPDELLHLDSAPPELQRAVTAARDISQRATAMRLEAGTITPETAAAVGPRAAEQVHGGSRYDRNYVQPTPRVIEARQELQNALSAREAGPKLTPMRAVRRAFSAGRAAGRGSRNLELARPLTGTRRVPIVAGTRSAVDASLGRPAASVPRGPGISASRGRAYGQVLRGQGRGYSVRTGLKSSGALTRRVRVARREVAAAEREARGGWTPSSRTDVGRRGVYWPERPVDRFPGRQQGQPHGAFGRLSQDKVHENHGILFGMGNVSHDPRVLIQALDRALVDEMHPGFVEKMVDTFAFKGPDGKAAQGPKAVMAAAADPDHVVLASRKSVQDAMRLGRDAPEGSMPDSPLRGVQMYEGDAGLAQVRELPASMQNDLIALPKAAVDAVREGYGQSAPAWMSWYDTPLQLWRRGILAFAPRWYLNNLFGNTFQFGMLTGGDAKAIGQARSPIFDKAVPEQIAGSTLVNETRMLDPNAPASAFRRGFERASNVGMDFNQKLEAILRRAAYINRAKKGLKDSGVRIRKMSDQELADAIEHMPPELIDHAVNETHLFMGDYVRMSAFERNVLKRIFPFYSWMRVIGKFMLVVPFRHPKRVALVAAVARGAQATVNPNDPILPIYDRGRINLPGGLVMRTMGANPLATHAELVSALSTGGPSAVVKGTINSLTRDVTPGLQPFFGMLTGRNVFGRPYSAPPGFDGTVQSYGQDPQSINPATGLPETNLPTPSLFEMALQTLPTVPTIARGMLAGGETPYDTASTLDLLRNRAGLGGKPDWQLFKRRTGERATNPLIAHIRGVPVPMGPILSMLGTNLQHANRQAEINRYFDQQARLEKAAANTQRQAAKVAGGR